MFKHDLVEGQIIGLPVAIHPDVAKARSDDPMGIWCGHCGKINQLADDAGWFYAYSMWGDYLATCGCVETCSSMDR